MWNSDWWPHIYAISMHKTLWVRWVYWPRSRRIQNFSGNPNHTFKKTSHVWDMWGLNSQEHPCWFTYLCTALSGWSLLIPSSLQVPMKLCHNRIVVEPFFRWQPQHWLGYNVWWMWSSFGRIFTWIALSVSKASNSFMNALFWTALRMTPFGLEKFIWSVRQMAEMPFLTLVHAVGGLVGPGNRSAMACTKDIKAFRFINGVTINSCPWKTSWNLACSPVQHESTPTEGSVWTINNFPMMKPMWFFSFSSFLVLYKLLLSLCHNRTLVVGHVLLLQGYSLKRWRFWVILVAG